MRNEPTGDRPRPERTYTALILAGRRPGVDLLAEAVGAPHRTLLDIHGVPMLEGVVQTLRDVPRIARTLVSTDAPDLLRQCPGLLHHERTGDISIVASEQSASRRVLEVLQTTPPTTPLLVTTADHALLTPEIVEYFLTDADRSEADLAFALVAASRLRARFPHSKRTYIPFRGESYSGANLFAFRTSSAQRAADFWTGVEERRKEPWRLARAFGPGALLAFLLRLLDLESAMRHASRVIGVRVQAVPLPFAEAAVDVDRVGDLMLVRQVLAGRAANRQPSLALPRLRHAH